MCPGCGLPGRLVKGRLAFEAENFSLSDVMIANPCSHFLFSRLLLVCFSCAAFAVADAEEIEVSSTSGQSMTVEVLGYTASSGNVQIKRSDGQIFNTKISVFDDESQKKIIANAPKEMAKLDIDVSIGRKRERQGGSFYMKNMTVSTSVKVSNQSRDIDLAKTDFTILLVGRNSRRYANRDEDWYKILSVQKFSTELAAGKSSEFELNSFKTAYDSDKDSSNVGGWEFEGYLLVGLDAEGKIVATKTTLGEVGTVTLKEDERTLAALKLSEGTETEHDLSPRGRR